MKPEHINLFFQRGTSDKVYQVQLNQVELTKENPYHDELWVVNFQYGRRGSSLVGGTKTPVGLTYWHAKRTYDTLVRSKVRKGYMPKKTDTVSYTPFQQVAKKVKARTTDFLPQLLKQVTLAEAKKLYKANVGNIFMQTKHDGERRGVLVTDKVLAANRRGLEVQIQQSVADACTDLTKQWTDILEIDTEDMGSHLVLFDVLQAGGEDIRNKMFAQRCGLLKTLQMAINQAGLGNQLKIDIPYQPDSYEEFIDFINYAQATNEEGVVIRLGTGRYEPGLGDSCYKLKFYADATVQVWSVHATKRSIGIAALNKNSYHNIGNCAIPANRDIPKLGNFVEVRYLYAYEGGSLYQPFYKGLRSDKTEADSIDSLQYKKENK